MVLLVVVNYTNVVTEFIGIAGSMQLFHLTKFISVPFFAALVWFMVLSCGGRPLGSLRRCLR